MSGVSEHFVLEEIAEGVHAAVATPRGFALCNSGIVDLGGSSLVFDAMLTPQAGTALGRAAERLTGSPVGLLVNSHYHGDHVRGSAAVGAAHVVSTRRVRELVLERGPLHLRSDRQEAQGELQRLRAAAASMPPDDLAVYEGWFGGILATAPDLAFRAPDLTFESELVVHGRRRSARLLTFGGGHSPSDVLVHLPEERIVFLGDLLSVGFHPSLGDSNPEEFARILGEVERLRGERTLPGHGPVSDAAAVREMARYLALLRRSAAEACARRVPREELVRQPPPEPFGSWKLSTIYRDNVGFLYDREAARSAGAASGRPGT